MKLRLRTLNLIRSVNPVFGGPAEGVRQSVAAARELGHVEEVLTLDAPGEPWVAAFPALTHAVGPSEGTYGYTPRLLPWLQQHAAAYDALVVHGLWQYHGLAARRAVGGSGRPYLVYPHGMLDPWFRRSSPGKHAKKWLYWLAAERAVLRDAAAVIFTTQEEARLATTSFKPYSARHQVLGYGLALDKAARQACAEDFLQCHPELQGRRLLLFLGRLHPKKGCDLLVSAFAQLAGQDPRLHLVMAGPDALGLQPGLQAQAQRLGVAARITFTGMLEGAAKWGALRAAEAFVLPSHQENFGIAVAEALAVGTPVLLSTQVNTWREVVDAGAGLAEPDTLPGTVALLARWLALSDAERLRMRAATLPCFERHFHSRGSAQRLAALVRSLHPPSPGHAWPLPAGGHGADSQSCNTGRPQ